MALSTSTKSQVWSIDLTVAIIIFLTALVLFYKYSINITDMEKKEMGDFLLDGKIISSYLISKGYPEDWTTSDVTLIGLTNGNMDINPNKVESFHDLTDSVPKYQQSKKLLSTTHDYYVFFEDKNNNTLTVRGVEGIGGDYKTENPEDIIKITRFVYYNSTIIRMVLYIW